MYAKTWQKRWYHALLSRQRRKSLIKREQFTKPV
jgi:hypothetical protein